jgi:hypothetical protein
VIAVAIWLIGGAGIGYVLWGLVTLLREDEMHDSMDEPNERRRLYERALRR